MARLATGESGNDNEVLNANNLPAGTYYIRVTGWAGARNNYNLQINLVPLNSNTPPIANADAITTNEDTTISFNPVTNDTDANGDILSITAVTNGTKGNATFIGNTISYTPSLNANGSDSITYTISDGHGGSATGTVTITITPINDAPIANADYETTSEDTVISFNPETNDTDVDGDILNITSVSNGTKGSTSRIGNTVTYTPNLNANGSDTLSYTIIDGNGGSSTGTIHITITPVNDAPVAVTDILNATTENNGGVFTSIPALFDVLANDTDVENDTLSITNVTTPLHGTAVIQNNKILYTTNTGYSGPDSFSYTISDGQASSSVAVSITVGISYINSSPVVENVYIEGTQIFFVSGQEIEVVVQFDFAVVVTGVPSILLSFNNGPKIANYISGSGTNMLHFKYTVQVGDFAPAPLNYVDAESLGLNGGTIKLNGSSSVNANLTLPTTNLSTSLIQENASVDALTSSFLYSFSANGVDGFITQDQNGYYVDFFFSVGQNLSYVVPTFSISPSWHLRLDNIQQTSGKDVIDLNQPVLYQFKANDGSITKNILIRANIGTFKLTSSALVNGNGGENIEYLITTNSAYAVSIQVSNLPAGFVFDGVNKISGTVSSAVDVETNLTLTSNNQTIKAKILFDFNLANNFTNYQLVWRPDYQITAGAWGTTVNLLWNDSVRSLINKSFLDGHSKIRFKIKAAPSTPLIFKGFAIFAQTTGPSGTLIQHVTFDGVDHWNDYITVPANTEIVSDVINLPVLTSNLLYSYHADTVTVKSYSGTAATQSWISSDGWWEANWSNRSNYGISSQFLVTTVEAVDTGVDSDEIAIGSFLINNINGVLIDTNGDGIKDTIDVILPINSKIQKLTPSFALNGPGIVLLDEIVQTSDVSTVDFSTIQKYRVQSTLNSSEKIYYVRVKIDYQEDLNFDDINDLVDGINVISTNMDHDGDAVTNLLESFLKIDPFSADTDQDMVNDNSDGFPLDPSFTQIPSGQSSDLIKPEITVTLPVNLTIVQ